MMGWGPFQNLWYDADCNQATNLVPTIGYFCKGWVTMAFYLIINFEIIFKFHFRCPTGWSMFNGRCYKVRSFFLKL